MIPNLISRSLVPIARVTSTTTGALGHAWGCFPPSPSCRAGRIPWPSQRRPRCGRARSRSSSRRLLESSWLLIPYRTDRGQDLIAGLAEGVYSHAAWARSQRGLPWDLVCRRNTSTPPTRQAPTLHGVQLVSPSRRSGRETAWSASGGILAGVPEGGGGWGRNGSLAARSCSRSHSSCFAFRVAAPARPAATVFGSLT